MFTVVLQVVCNCRGCAATDPFLRRDVPRSCQVYLVAWQSHIGSCTSHRRHNPVCKLAAIPGAPCPRRSRFCLSLSWSVLYPLGLCCTEWQGCSGRFDQHESRRLLGGLGPCPSRVAGIWAFGLLLSGLPRGWWHFAKLHWPGFEATRWHLTSSLSWTSNWSLVQRRISEMILLD